MGWPWLAVICPPSCSLVPHPQQQEKIRWKKLLGWDKDKDVTYQWLSWVTQLGGSNLIYCQLIKKEYNEKLNIITFPQLPTSFFPGSTSLPTLPPPLHPPSVTWEWGLWSVDNSSLCFSSSFRIVSILYRVLPIGDRSSSPWVLPMGCSASRSSLGWILSRCPVLWEWTAAVWWVPYGPQVLPEWSLSRVFRNSPGKGVAMMRPLSLCHWWERAAWKDK